MFDTEQSRKDFEEAIERCDKERLVRIATKAFFEDTAHYEDLRKLASHNGYFLVIKPQKDFFGTHTFNFGLVITEKSEQIYFGCKHGWDFPDVIEDWYGEGNDRTMMKAFLLGLFEDLAKGIDKSTLKKDTKKTQIPRVMTLGELRALETIKHNEEVTSKVPDYAKRTAQDAFRRLQEEYPKILSQNDVMRLEGVHAIDL